MGAIAITNPVLHENVGGVAESIDHSMRVEISIAEMWALNANYVRLTPTPEDDKAYVFLGAILHKRSGGAFTDRNLRVGYASGGSDVGQLEGTGVLDSAGTRIRVIRPYAPASGDSKFAISFGRALELKSTNGLGGAGRQTTVTTFYREVRRP